MRLQARESISTHERDRQTTSKVSKTQV